MGSYHSAVDRFSRSLDGFCGSVLGWPLTGRATERADDELEEREQYIDDGAEHSDVARADGIDVASRPTPDLAKSDGVDEGDGVGEGLPPKQKSPKTRKPVVSQGPSKPHKEARSGSGLRVRLEAAHD